MQKRERVLSSQFADAIANYMNQLTQEHHAEMGFYQNGKLVTSGNKVYPSTIQSISVDDTKSMMLNFPETQSQVLYHGSNPYEVKTMGPEGSKTLYLDELYLMSVQKEPQKESQKQVQSTMENASKPLMLVGVSPQAVRFRENQGGQKWVNIAIPWSQSQNNLGNIDIPRDLFDKANTEKDMQSRKTYHIPLMEKQYGIWYRDKETGQSVKPVVSAKEIYQSYEANRAAYRQKQQQMQSPAVSTVELPKSDAKDVPVESTVRQTASVENSQGKTRELPDIPGVTDIGDTDFAVDDMDFDLE